nr:hypothetical protein [uncultured Neokomagataea sp.]
MDTNLLVGDLIRTKESSVNQNLTDLGKRARGPYFLGRHPALVLQRGIYGYGARDLATITYKQKNGKWSNRNTIICLRYFELVSRPQKSAFLNPFKTWEAYEQRRSITLVKSKKCVYSFQWANSVCTTDPDTPLMYQPLPMSHAELRAYIRLALSKTSDHESRRENGVMPREYLDEIFQRTTMNFDPVFEEYAIQIQT